jgi:hypothetical protein
MGRREISAMSFLFAVVLGGQGIARGQDGAWRPTEAQVARAEKLLQLPVGAGGPLSSYDRYYTGVIERRRQVIYGELLGLARMPRSPGVVKIVSQKQMPAIGDGGCSVMTFTFDPITDAISPVRCNFELPPPPPPPPISATEAPPTIGGCIKVPGTIGGPTVPTPKAARDIYKATTRARGDIIRPTNEIRVSDEGDHWSVFQYPRHIQPPKVTGRIGTVSVVIGGGTLEMTIEKCDGAISASYSR